MIKADITIFSLTFDALAAGTSTVLTSAGGGLGGVSLLGTSVSPPFTVAGGTVTVNPANSAIPEPTSLIVWSLLGVVCMVGGVGVQRRKLVHKT